MASFARFGMGSARGDTGTHVKRASEAEWRGLRGGHPGRKTGRRMPTFSENNSSGCEVGGTYASFNADQVPAHCQLRLISGHVSGSPLTVAVQDLG